jgi:hypothetical protein
VGEFKIDKDNIDLHEERIDAVENQNIVTVRDAQVYELMDFEFLQKLKVPKRSFILRKYNKLLTQNQEMPFL